jgi:predicted Zn-ribbon and HTH transcriptional regulator
MEWIELWLQALQETDRIEATMAQEPSGRIDPSEEKPLTLREEIAVALSHASLDLREISQMFRIREKEALDHLQHIARSAHWGRFIMEPAGCNRCGFLFKKRDRLNTPSRCPLCKSESISPPRFGIKES